MNLIIKAAQFAACAHQGQMRKYGHANRPYITHPARVAGRVAITVGATEEMVAAAWLHDVIEDCGVTAVQLDEHFTSVVVKLVEELTNPSKAYPNLPRAERKLMDLEHIIGVSRKAKLIKLADRVDNLMETNDSPLTPRDFIKLYRKESAALLEVLRGVEPGLEQELEVLV